MNDGKTDLSEDEYKRYCNAMIDLMRAEASEEHLSLVNRLSWIGFVEMTKVIKSYKTVNDLMDDVCTKLDINVLDYKVEVVDRIVRCLNIIHSPSNYIKLDSVGESSLPPTIDSRGTPLYRPIAWHNLMIDAGIDITWSRHTLDVDAKKTN